MSVHRTWITTLLVGAGLSFGSATSFAHAAEATANATVSILEPLSISKSQDLSFGAVRTSGEAGEVSVSASGARSASSGVGLVSSGSAAAASFQITAAPDAVYTISVPATFAVGPFEASTSGLVGPLPSSGAGSFSVGASLAIPANATPGTYGGALVITAAYD